MKKVMYFMAAAALTVLASCGNSEKASDATNNNESATDTTAVENTEAAVPQVNAEELLAGKTVEAIADEITLDQCLSLAEQLKEWGDEAAKNLTDQAGKEAKAKAVEESVNAHPFMARANAVLKAVMDNQELSKKLGVKGETYQKLYKATQAYGAFVTQAEFQDAGAPLENLADYVKK